MRKSLLIFAVAFLAVAVAMPAFAAVEFKYGGQFRVRTQFNDNIQDGTSVKGYYSNFAPDALANAANIHNSDDNRRFVDQRLRLYFTFQGSQNLKVVVKFEHGDTIWGDNIGGGAGRSQGGGVGADGVAVEVKNAYVEFNIPGCPSTGIVGIQTLTLLDSWIVDDDFSAAVLVTKLDPFRLTMGYVAGQYGADTVAPFPNSAGFKDSGSDFNVDAFFLALDYNCAPWKAALVFFWQDGHRSSASMDPNTLLSPYGGYVGAPLGSAAYTTGNLGFFTPGVESNQLFDLGFNITYKVDWLLAYVNFVKNFGTVDFAGNVLNVTNGINQRSADYTGFMVDAGVTYFCPPYTLNVGGFYTTGPSFSETVGGNNYDPARMPFRGTSSTDVEWFTYPLATTKYTSEIIGAGVLENGFGTWPGRGYAMGTPSAGFGTNGYSTMYWRGAQMPTNIWTLTVGGSWQICPGSKLSASYWYWGTAESVPVAFAAGTTIANINANTRFQMASDIGHEFNIYFDQEIVDGLTLTLVGAYLAAGDAFCPLPTANGNVGAIGVGPTQINPANYTTPQAEDAFKLGARLQWNF